MGVAFALVGNEMMPNNFLNDGSMGRIDMHSEFLKDIKVSQL